MGFNLHSEPSLPPFMLFPLRRRKLSPPDAWWTFIVCAAHKAGNKSHTSPLCLLQLKIKITPSICPQLPGTRDFSPKDSISKHPVRSLWYEQERSGSLPVLSTKAVSFKIKIVLVVRGEPSTEEGLRGTRLCRY